MQERHRRLKEEAKQAATAVMTDTTQSAPTVVASLEEVRAHVENLIALAREHVAPEQTLRRK